MLRNQGVLIVEPLSIRIVITDLLVKETRITEQQVLAVIQPEIQITEQEVLAVILLDIQTTEL
jgi:hypothetical protein